ncbi:uncharacterized protein BJ212DRAFT_1299431 [Suillus subaureus]|uniref:Uncharacterized protein n=1 Tax=Suillus subaureus TaxID=48587 RepID=A0A9P7JE44_9AGAM|nr:uncharacterized protein BJ212DRAFT_1299431 [Suillus subaureus]KAG1817299.1 hypothetical protein BJ212DRAFT_1299431 [Suillus subaureus]
MPRIKKIGRQRHGGTVLQPHFKPVHKQYRAMTAAKSAAKHAAISGALPQPIRDFRIPVTKAELSMDQWDARAPHRIHYGVPELISYGAGDAGQLEFLRVPAMKDQRILGYVLLPARYRSSWVYLCYCVEYWLAVWKCWDGESKKHQKQKKTKAQQERAVLIDTSRKNAGARFLQAMVARRIVLEECVANGVNDERIKSLDEFLIRDHRDWLFVEFDELPDDADIYLEADPLHPENKKIFETGWGVNVNDISMMLGQADDAWMSKGLDLSVMFKKEMDAALKRLRDGGEEVHITHDENAELPDRWHESHEPPIQFISKRKDQLLRAVRSGWTSMSYVSPATNQCHDSVNPSAGENGAMMQMNVNDSSESITTLASEVSVRQGIHWWQTFLNLGRAKTLLALGICSLHGGHTENGRNPELSDQNSTVHIVF